MLNLGVFVRDLEHGSQTCKRAVHRGSAEALLNSLLSKLVRTFGCDLCEGRAQARTVRGGIQQHKNRSRLSWANPLASNGCTKAVVRIARRIFTKAY